MFLYAWRLGPTDKAELNGFPSPVAVDEIREFSEDDLTSLQSLADLGAQAITNA
jgi:hypothetical protein